MIPDAIVTGNLIKRYGRGCGLNGFSLSVPTGATMGLVGQNGAGKTTTINLILDIIKRDAGDIKVFGQSIDKDSARLREDIGVVFDEMGFHEFMTGRDINIMMKNIYKNWDEIIFFEYLKRFSLPSKKKCGSFSRGMRMKLQIAVALSHHAKLLIMDEPTSGLDPIVRNEILDIFREFVLREDHTILLSSHITGDLEKLADEVVFIDGGRIVLSGNKDEILEQHGILKCDKAMASKIDDNFVIHKEISSFGAEILVDDRKIAANLYPNLILEPASLEKIMLHYASRKRG